MNLFHHITVLLISESEKRDFLEAGIEFIRATKTSQGETVTFEIGENDARYQRVTALLRSFDAKRLRDWSMTVPTLREYIEKIVQPSAERLKQQGYFAKQAKWERGREVMQQSLEFLKAGQKDQALSMLNDAIAEAIRGSHGTWVSLLCRHAAAVARSMGDRQRQINYEEQALPFAENYRFAAYNLAQLLFRDGQSVRAERYAAEAYTQSVMQTTDADHDLVRAILRQWPGLAANN